VPPDSRELRTVTVLFTDLSGFTRMSETLDPEDVADTIDALFQRFRSIIESLGGTVDKFIGDAAMAVFGAPVAHADDPARAVRAGLRLQEELARFNAERSLALRMRVGVNTGEVLWGSVGGEPRPTAMGDAVNVAQRLEGAAAAGSVLVSRSTARAAAAFDYEPGPSVRLKGREESVEVLVALGERASAPDSGPAMLGRDAELARLVETLERGGAVALTGDAGSGKSRLLAAFREKAAGATVLSGRSPEGDPSAMAPFTEILRAAAGSDSPSAIQEALAAGLRAAGVRDEEAAAIALRLRTSAGLTAPDEVVPELPPERLEEETRFAWDGWFRALAARAPVAVCFDDLHWAAPPSRALLEALAARRGAARILYVAASRPEGAVPAGFEPMPLGELAASDARRLAEGELGGPVADDLALYLARATAGNPYYVLEASRYLRDEKLVAGPPWRLVVLPDRIPGSLSGLLVARLDALPAPERQLLKEASVLGRAVWRGILPDLLERPVDAELDAVRLRDLLRPHAPPTLTGEEEFVYVHALLRGAAYSLLTRRERARLHGRAADLLEARAPEYGRRALAIAARQREAAGETAAAAGLWLRAGKGAADARAWEDTLACGRDAVRLGEALNGGLLVAQALQRLGRWEEAILTADAVLAEAAAAQHTRRHALLVLARCHQFRGEYEKSLAAADRLLLEVPLEAELLVALRTRAFVLRRLSRFPEALETLERARRILDENPCAPWYAICRPPLLVDIGWIHTRLGDFDRARNLLEEAVGLFPAVADPEGEAAALSTLSAAISPLGNCARVRELRERALALRRRLGDRLEVASALLAVALARDFCGDTPGGGEAYREALLLARSLESPPMMARALTLHAYHLRDLGRTGDALADLDKALEIHRTLGDRHALETTLSAIGELRTQRGDLDVAEAAIGESTQICREMGDAEGEAFALMAQAEILRRRRRPDEAVAILASCLPRFRESRNTRGEFHTLLHAAVVRLEMGDRTEAGAIAEDLLCRSRDMGDRRGEARTLLVLGDVARAAGDPRGASMRYAQADRILADLQDRIERGRALASLARALRDCGDADGAETAARDAKAVYPPGTDPEIDALVAAL
jgi:class 3 adenylate cyclase/tetratricopeptide (TPR) repeat protein